MGGQIWRVLVSKTGGGKGGGGIERALKAIPLSYTQLNAEELGFNRI